MRTATYCVHVEGFVTYGCGNTRTGVGEWLCWRVAMAVLDGCRWMEMQVGVELVMNMEMEDPFVVGRSARPYWAACGGTLRVRPPGSYRKLFSACVCCSLPVVVAQPTAGPLPLRLRSPDGASLRSTLRSILQQRR